MAYTNLISLFKAICDAIRSKTGTTESINHQDIPAKIKAIETGITPTGTKSITSNGTHDVTAYASASVNVPVPNGYIKPSGTKSITANGNSIDVNSYQYVNVNVPVPSGYVYPSGNKAITSNGSGIDVKNYSTVSVNVPVPDGYVNPTYRDTNQFDIDLSPGDTHNLAAGTYIQYGYTVSASMPIIDAGRQGYAGTLETETRTDLSNIKFSIPSGIVDDNILGWWLMSNDMDIDSASTSYDNILGISCTMNTNSEYKYAYQTYTVDNDVFTGLTSDTSIIDGWVEDDGVFRVWCGDGMRFKSGLKYYFCLFYVQ